MPGLSGFYVNLLHQISLHIFQGHFDEDTGSEWPDYEPIMIDLDFARIGRSLVQFLEPNPRTGYDDPAGGLVSEVKRGRQLRGAQCSSGPCGTRAFLDLISQLPAKKRSWTNSSKNPYLDY